MFVVAQAPSRASRRTLMTLLGAASIVAITASAARAGDDPPVSNAALLRKLEAMEQRIRADLAAGMELRVSRRRNGYNTTGLVAPATA